MEKVLNKIYEWIDKIGKHNFMLIVFILIVTIVTGLYTTFSIMTSTGPSELIDGLLTYKFILNADSDTNSVTIAAGSSKLLDITVSNEEDTKLQYGIYYSATDDINIGYVKNSTYPSTGLIEGKQNYIVTIKVDNNTNNDVTINFGLSFGLEKGGDLVLPEGSTIVGKYTEYGNAAKFVQSLYEDGSSINTVHIAGNTEKPQVHLNSTQGIMLDNNGDYRYYGASPNNYVEYNGELWRIISSGTIYSSEEDTTGEQRVRIIRAESIGAHPWDYYNDGNYANNWSNATLNKTLNGIYYNRTSGTCYLENYENICNYSDNETIKGLSSEARKLIDDALWYLGGSSEYEGLYADDYYTFERGTVVSTEGYPTRTVAKLGIMYPSDYTYAADLSLCKNNGYNYEVENSNCTETDWLFNSDFQWLVSPYSDSLYLAFGVGSSGCVYYYDSDYASNDGLGVRPVAVLKSDVVIKGGQGTSDNPYKLSIELTEEVEQAETAEYGEAATTYIHDLYKDGTTKTEATVGDGPQTVKLNSSKGIMYINQGDTYGEEYRYYGSTPNNYVSFNGELWRIISSSKVYLNKEDTTGSQRLRIIRSESIGDYAWDVDTDGNGTDTVNNNWETATLNTTLNGIYYNGTSGSCYLGETDDITGDYISNTCDYSGTGTIKGLSSEARSLIDDAVWYLGGSPTYEELYASDFYTLERGTEVSTEGYPTSTVAKLGIMYPSDYAYAVDLSKCTYPAGYTSSGSYSSDTTNCTGTDWLFNSSNQWTVFPFSSWSGVVLSVYSSGAIGDEHSDDALGNGVGARPLAVLKSNVTITGGKGTSGEPYTLGLSS